MSSGFTRRQFAEINRGRQLFRYTAHARKFISVNSAFTSFRRDSPRDLRFKGLVFLKLFGDSRFMELVFSVTQENDGGYVAECLSHDIFTQGDSWEQLRANVREAVSAYFFDQPKPGAVRLHLVRDELLAGA
jgi:hypothetical protein